jgi:hypothetical protein
VEKARKGEPFAWGRECGRHSPMSKKCGLENRWRMLSRLVVQSQPAAPTPGARKLSPTAPRDSRDLGVTSSLAVRREACGRQLAIRARGSPRGATRGRAGPALRASETACIRLLSPGTVVQSPDPSCCSGYLRRPRLRRPRCSDRVPGSGPRAA